MDQHLGVALRAGRACAVRVPFFGMAGRLASPLPRSALPVSACGPAPPGAGLRAGAGLRGPGRLRGVVSGRPSIALRGNVAGGTGTGVPWH